MSIKKNKRIVVIFSIITGLGVLFLLMPVVRFSTPYSTIISGTGSQLLAGHIAGDGQWRFPPGDSVPHKFQRAILLFEDEYFFSHPGFNPVSLVKAGIRNVRSGRVVSGGSTLTMQVVRLHQPARRTIPNKIRELVLSMRLEAALSKDSILALYASQAPFGGNTVGLEAAAWRYFNRPSHELTWAEASLLAVLPNAPALMHPGRNREPLMAKRNRLLEKLYTKGEIDSLSWVLSLAEPLPQSPLPMPQITPHLLEEALINRKGMKNVATIDVDLQQRAMDIVNRHGRILQQNEIHNVAAVVACVETGRVLAHIGNLAGHSAQHVNILHSPRSSGSILKPFLYAAALEDGIILPQSLLADIPTWYRSFSPRNFQRRYDGAVPADRALSRSLNVPFVRLLDSFGGEKFLRKLHNCGLNHMNHPWSHYGLSLILGGSETTLWELTGAYASMARILNHYNLEDGTYCSHDVHGLYAMGVSPKVDRARERLEHPSLFQASAIYATFRAMMSLERPEEESGWEHFSSSRQIAWKTGTSYGYRDAWSVGITPEYVVGVWVGNATGEGRPGILGGSTAGPVMFELFNLLPSTTHFEIPYDDMIRIAVCRQSGFRAGNNCHSTDSLWIPSTVRKTGPCPYHQLVHLTPDGRYRTSLEWEPSGQIRTENFFLLPPVMEWYYKPNHPGYRTLPPQKPGCSNTGTDVAMEFIYPPANTTLLIPVDMDGQMSRMVISAVHRNPQAKIYWHINGNYLGMTDFKHEMEYFPQPGENLITLIDEEGNRVTRRFICAGGS